MAGGSHSLRGECGLKSELHKDGKKIHLSLSARRVWIEINRANHILEFAESLSARRVWIEIM